MSSKFRKVKLCEILSFKTGKLDSNAAVDNGCYPFFTCSPVTLSINTYAFDTEAVLLAGNNANGVFSVKYHNGKFNAYQRTYVITPLNNSEVNVKWLYFRIKYVTSELQSMSVGTATKFLTKKILDAFEIELPTFEEQTYQAKILWGLQDKLANNEAINQTLEQMAQALFKSWFVDFEPVKAKIAVLEEGGSQEDAILAAMTAISGKDADALAVFEREHPEQYAELKATAELFPSAMQESELGEVPEGWRTENVENIINRLKVKNTFPADCIKQFGQYPVLEQGAKIYLGYHDEEPSFDASLQNPMFIFGDHTCVMHLSTVPFDISKNTLVLNGKEFNSYWTFFALKGKQKFQEYKRHWSDLKVKQVIIPDKSNGLLLTKYFASKCENLFGLLEENRKQNLTLTNLRDTLLPKLLSGEITLPEAEQAVSEAENV